MAVESFTELLHKLKEVHDQELEGLQQKVIELSNKKSCDGKRLEELYNRNQQLREQHKMLTENIKQLENMLRAGLCDRCTVTQELAKKKQQEYESSHLQSLQHISILMGEISVLVKENDRLREEMKTLRGQLEQQNGHLEKARTPEVKQSSDNGSTPASLPISVLKNGQATLGGATTPQVTVKTESERNNSTETLREKEEAAAPKDKGSTHKTQGWSLTPSIEVAKPTPLAASQVMWKERRAASVESLDPRPSPSTPPTPTHIRLLKHSPFFSPRRSEERPSLVSIPLRPHPIKTAPPALSWSFPEQSDWMAAVSAGSSGVMVRPNLKHESSPTMAHFPALVTSCLQSQSPQSPLHPLPACPPSRALLELTDNKNKKAATSSWTSSPSKRIFGENLREGDVETPLDLSNAGTSKTQETDSASSSSSSPPAPLSSPSSAQYASSPQSDTPAGDSKPKTEETEEKRKDKEGLELEKNENVDTGNLKVPTLTISLRPVVVLESLKSAGKSILQDNSQDQLKEEESKQGLVRKRSAQTLEAFKHFPCLTDTALSRHSLKEKRLKMTGETQSNHQEDAEQG